jgi:hypothetical protein
MKMGLWKMLLNGVWANKKAGLQDKFASRLKFSGGAGN